MTWRLVGLISQNRYLDSNLSRSSWNADYIVREIAVEEWGEKAAEVGQKVVGYPQHLETVDVWSLEENERVVEEVH
jgi:hypothetical protein